MGHIIWFDSMPSSSKVKLICLILEIETLYDDQAQALGR